MSEPTKRVRFQDPRFSSEPARLEHRSGLVPPIQVAEEAVRDIRDSVRKNLENYYPSSESPEAHNNDALEPNEPRVNRVTFRRDYSPISVDLSILNPGENMNNNEAIEREIERMRAQQAELNVAAACEVAGEPTNGTSNTILAELVQSIREIQTEMQYMREQMHTMRANRGNTNETRTNSDDVPLDITYGRTERDIRNRRSAAPHCLPLKEARIMIPEFDGTSRHKLQEFLNACTYAVQNINPADEESLMQAILYTKLKGKAMQDFETRDVQTFEELKRQLETCYQTKQSTTHLQIEFNSLKQKSSENAYAFGQRVDLIAMKLYESMVEGEERSHTFKRAIQETIKKQALINYQIGLREELKILVRSQRYTTLQEAINGASMEEKLIRPTGTQAYGFSNKNDNKPTRANRDPKIQCYKCGKNGHYGRDCRNNKFTLPKPEKNPRVNTLNKFCKYCKKTGHTREECWNLNGHPKVNSTTNNRNSKPVNKIKHKESVREQKTPYRQRKKSTDSSSNSEEEEEEARRKQPRPASEYRISHVKDIRAPSKKELLQITLPIQEVKNNKINMLYDSGSTISLLKLRNLKDNAPIYEKKIALIGISGHKVYTIGKMYATININEHKIKHTFYIIKDDTAIEHEGILGLDFLKKQKVKCDFEKNEIKIKNAMIKLHSCEKITLKPRSETIIRAATNRNQIGIVRTEEAVPGVYIGNCLVEPENFSCPVSIINATDKIVEMTTPIITLEELENSATNEINAIQSERKIQSNISRSQRI